jgi:all-trans-retinol 13,14-reductase
MTGEWDTVVIGAGVGGLTGAAKLARAGQRVIVLERNPHPGGTAYSYRRNGFAFPMGPLGYSNRDAVGEILRDLTGGRDLDYQRVHYRLRAFGLEAPLSLSFRELTRELATLFPQESHAIERFFEDVESIATAIHLDDEDSDCRAGGFRRASAAEYLQGMIEDRKLRRILGSLGTREPYSSLPLLASMWNLMCREGIWYPSGGPRALCDELVGVVAGHGGAGPARDEAGQRRRTRQSTGAIRLETEVRRIVVEKGRATGVVLADGSAVNAGAVISNADYKTTYLELVEPGQLAPDWRRAVSQARQTDSVVQVGLGVDGSRVDLSAFEGASRVIYRRGDGDSLPNEESAWDARDADPRAVAGRELEISLLTREDRGLAPPGGEVVVIRVDAPYSHFAQFRVGTNRRTAGYRDYKVRLARALIDEAAVMIPGLEDGIQVVDVATPLTFRDRGGRSEGAVAGWSWDHEDSRDHRLRDLVLTPVRGLYMAGYQAFSALLMGGVPTAMESGCRAARAALDNAGPAEEVTIPGSG